MKRGIWFILAGLLWGCAQQVNPTGGPKDVAPPQIVSSYPDNFSLYYNGNKVSLKFDEFIQPNNLSSKLIISPGFGTAVPEIKFKPKEVTVVFPDTLSANTTYAINFSDGIVDLHERNPLDSNVFVFSTGSYVDSMSLTGLVRDARSLKPEPDMLVMLYRDLSDSAPLKLRPDYIGKTAKDGHYAINYLSKGRYRVFALKDKNADYLFNLPDEKIAFSTQVLQLDAPDTINMDAFIQLPEEQTLLKASSDNYGEITFYFALPVEDPVVTTPGFSSKKPWFLPEYSKTKDTLTYWLTGTEGMDSLVCVVKAKGMTPDTVELALAKKSGDGSGGGRRGKKKAPFKLDVHSNVVSKKLRYGKPLHLRWNHPVEAYDVRQMWLISKGDSTHPEMVTDDPALRRFVLKTQLKEDTDYKLYCTAGSFTDIYGLASDTIDLPFHTGSVDETVQLTIFLSCPESWQQNIIIIHGNNRIEGRYKTNSHDTLALTGLPPGNYTMELLRDKNSNGQWDPGNYQRKKQPEPVRIYGGEHIQLKAGWDQEIKWKLVE